MVIEIPSLYPHQEKMRDEVRDALRRNRRVILCAPPGTGKTRLSKHILGAFANRPTQENESGLGLFAVHRRGLVDNASNSFSESPRLPHGVIMSQRKARLDESVQVASIDTVNSWFVDGDQFLSDTYDFIVFDETHSHVSKLRSMLLAHDAKRERLGLKPAFVLGLSATPQHKDLNQVYREIVKGPPPQWLIDNHFLSPFRYFRCTQGKAGLLVKRGDEYTDDSLTAAMEGLSGNMIEDWKKHAEGRATVGFFHRRAGAQEAVGLFQQAGVRAAYVDGETKDEERIQIFRDLNEGRLDYVANVGVIERGTDIPRIGCVQMCTFVGSIVRWLQMIGRGSRIHPDVPDCIVLDHGDGIQKGWFFEDEVHWTLEWGDRPAKTHEGRPTIQCPKCGLSYRGGRCKCGYEPTKKERKSQGLDFVGGELVEVTRKERKEKAKKTNEQLMLSALYMAGKRGLTYGAAWGIAKGAATKQGTEWKTPAFVEVGSSRHRMVPYGHEHSKFPVRMIYGFTVGDYSREHNPWRERD